MTREPIMLSPDLPVADPLAAYWLRQVTARLRREVCWLRHGRGEGSNDLSFRDPVQAALDLRRFGQEKKRFFQTDVTARYLTEQLEASPPSTLPALQGSFSWLLHTLKLDDFASFALTLGLAAASDNAMSSVIGFCLSDFNKTKPTLALAQKLWDEPEQVLTLVNPHHPLFRYGLLQLGSSGQPIEVDWDYPLVVPVMVVQQLLFPDPAPPPGLTVLNPTENVILDPTARLVASRLRAQSDGALRIVPILGPKGTASGELVGTIAYEAGKTVAALPVVPRLLDDETYLSAVATLCWLKGIDLFIELETASIPADTRTRLPLPAYSIPLTLYLGISEGRQLAGLPVSRLLPTVIVPNLSYHERKSYWQHCLGEKGSELGFTIEEISRRFRYNKATIRTLCRTLKTVPGPLSSAELIAACRAEVALDIGELAQQVLPRFEDETLILPPKQARQFQEVLRAMQALTNVHYRWGTAKAWNEGGITTLFAGPPGTGKTMAAEVLAIKLDLPIYRIDLSQVVNKYIGETEKNLKKLFDAADVSDMILFFDEADSLFGQRTEVKDAHDRYANLEISYLLERMERFKGLAILATNRKKDLDEAFLRRLRFIIDFPLPDEEQRARIWQQVIPKTVDRSEIDINFLAKQFRLAGGHIRSIVFHACLQSAGSNDHMPPFKLSMNDLIVAVKREYDKLNRNVSLESFGPYTDIIMQLEHHHEA